MSVSLPSPRADDNVDAFRIGLGTQFATQHLGTVVQVTLDRAEREPQPVGDLRDGEVVVIPQHDARVHLGGSAARARATASRLST